MKSTLTRPSARQINFSLPEIDLGLGLFSPPMKCYCLLTMKVIAELCVIPLGVGVSVSRYVAECEKILSEAGLRTVLHANGTNIEGEWDTVMAAIKRCHEKIHAMGAPRISSTLHIGTRTDRSQSMDEKVQSVRDKLKP